MNEKNQSLLKLLKQAMPRQEVDLRRDLWPRMRGRLEQPRFFVSRLDWVLAALGVLWLFLFPEALIAFLYHF